MSSIEKAIERFKKTSKFGSDELDIDFALADSYGKQEQPSESAFVDEQANGVTADDLPAIEEVSSREPVSHHAVAPEKNLAPLHPGRVKRTAHYTFNYEALSRQGFITPNGDRNSTAEEYRSLKRPLLMNAFGKGAVPVPRGNLVMVVSSLPGEGKTFSALNLAMSMAMEKDKTVLLVDSDVVKLSLTRLLGLEGRPGLQDALGNSETSIGDVIINTDLPNLSLIPAGKARTNSTELLASETMERVCAELSTRYPDRIVLFDAPPILVTNEAKVLSHQMGQILLVVEAGRTLQNVVTEALTHLDENKVIGLLLNKTRRAFRNDYYGGNDYYGSP